MLKNLLSKYEVLIKIVLTLVIIGVNFYRCPQLLYEPRFYAEEGQSFFAFAYNNSLLDYILTPMYGYYALYNVISTYLATLIKLEYSVFITIYMALCVQIITSAYVLWSDIPILDSKIKRFLVAIIFPLLCPAQIWLTTIGVQYWLCIITVLILLEKHSTESKSTYMLKAIVLLINGLTGVLSCLVTPLYIVKMIANKSKQLILFTGILCLCSGIQISIFISAYLKHDNGLAYRFVRDKSVIDFIYKTSILFFHNMLITRDLMVKLTTLDIINNIDLMINEKILNILGRPLFAQYELLYILNSIIIAIVLIPVIIKNYNKIDYLVIIFASLIIHYFSVFLSINFTSGNRYLFAPMAILMLLLVASINKNNFCSAYRYYSSIIIALIFLSHILDYTFSMNQTYNDNWPKWKEEVRLWRLDANHPLQIWPPPWQMNLKDAGN
jgi:hypothetical protein